MSGSEGVCAFMHVCVRACISACMPACAYMIYEIQFQSFSPLFL